MAGILVVPMFVLGISVFNPIGQNVLADTTTNIKTGVQAANGANLAQCLFANSANCSGTPIFTTIINVALYIIGAISVVMLIYGGIRYTTSGGNAANVTAAKNTILYAIVGIVVALLALAIVNFVVGQLTV
jgi:hypothetical protein